MLKVVCVCVSVCALCFVNCGVWCVVWCCVLWCGVVWCGVGVYAVCVCVRVVYVYVGVCLRMCVCLSCVLRSVCGPLGIAARSHQVLPTIGFSAESAAARQPRARLSERAGAPKNATSLAATL